MERRSEHTSSPVRYDRALWPTAAPERAPGKCPPARWPRCSARLFRLRQIAAVGGAEEHRSVEQRRRRRAPACMRGCRRDTTMPRRPCQTPRPRLGGLTGTAAWLMRRAASAGRRAEIGDRRRGGQAGGVRRAGCRWKWAAPRERARGVGGGRWKGRRDGGFCRLGPLFGWPPAPIVPSHLLPKPDPKKIRSRSVTNMRATSLGSW